MLLLPWAGYEYLGQISRTMMDGVAEAQNVRAQAITSYLRSRPQLFLPLLSPVGGDRVFFSQSVESPVVDAEFNEWAATTVESAGSPQASFARVRDTLFFALRFAQIELEGGEPDLRLYTRDQVYQLLFLSGGSVVAAFSDSSEMRLQDALLGSWKTETGIAQAEIALPAELTGGVFGLELVQGQTASSWGVGNDKRPLSWVTEQPELEAVLDIFRVEDSQMKILTTDNWVVASSGEISERELAPSLWESLFISLLVRNSGDGSSPQGISTESVQTWSLSSNPPRLTTEMPVSIGGLVVGSLQMESSITNFLQLYSVSLKRLLLISLTFILIVASVLFAYSSWLSRRIRQLSSWAGKLVDDQGQLNDQFPASSAADEIGELSRAYADLTQRLKKHTDYLQGLAGRLSHEIRTPLTIIGSSLENLENASNDVERATYTERARQGLERLRSLLRRMSEVTTLEAGIDGVQRQNFDPDKLVSELVSSYQQGFVNHRLEYQRVDMGQQVRIDGSPDLLAQLLDKLIENAVSFAPPQTTINICSGLGQGVWFLEVSNPGPLLPAGAGSDIFSSMVSLRNRSSDGEPHLGLGLTIVKRIAEFHQGNITAENRHDGSGVVFRLNLPCGAGSTNN